MFTRCSSSQICLCLTIYMLGSAALSLAWCLMAVWTWIGDVDLWQDHVRELNAPSIE